MTNDNKKQDTSITDKAAVSFNLPVSSRFICDCCGDEWEIAFKCEKCSNRLEPILDEDGFEDDYEKLDVCGNCCDCHLRSK